MSRPQEERAACTPLSDDELEREVGGPEQLEAAMLRARRQVLRVFNDVQGYLPASERLGELADLVLDRMGSQGRDCVFSVKGLLQRYQGRGVRKSLRTETVALVVYGLVVRQLVAMRAAPYQLYYQGGAWEVPPSVLDGLRQGHKGHVDKFPKRRQLPSYRPSPSAA